MKNLAKQLLTPQGYTVFESLESAITPVWSRLSSSSKKYHRRTDGSVPDIEEHTKEMLMAAGKIARMFGGSDRDNDILYLAVLLHDALKYGHGAIRGHTTGAHDKLIGDLVALTQPGAGYYSVDQLQLLENMVRYHSGQWSTDAPDQFSFGDYAPEVMFIHMLDMLSTADSLK